jgi:hypothetical protein
MTRCVGSPPPSSSHHHDRTRPLVSWSPRHIVTPLPCRTPNEAVRPQKVVRLSSPVKTRRGHCYWYSSPWNPGHITWYRGGSREGTPDEWETVGALDEHESAFVGWESSVCRWKLHLRISTTCPKRNIIKRREASRSITVGCRKRVVPGNLFFWIFSRRPGVCPISRIMQDRKTQTL